MFRLVRLGGHFGVVTVGANQRITKPGLCHELSP
jgi:hypothetical protein